MNIVNVGYDSTNYYVLATDKPLLLIDAGWPETLAKMEHACKRMGIVLSTIPYVLCTHYHPDHAGLVRELSQMGVKLIVMDVQRAEIDGIQLKVSESRAFLARIGIEGEIVHTPGHSDDSVTLVLDSGEAFTGDLTHSLMVEAGSEAHQSWERLRALGAHTIYAGHRPVNRIVP